MSVVFTLAQTLKIDVVNQFISKALGISVSTCNKYVQATMKNFTMTLKNKNFSVDEYSRLFSYSTFLVGVQKTKGGKKNSRIF